MWDQLSKHLNGTKPGTFLGWCVKLIFFRQLTRNDRGLYMLCYNCSLLRISINDIFCRLFWIFLFQARPHDTAPTPPPSHQNANYVIVRQFIAQTSDQLTVYEGELVTLERADPDWAYGKLSSFYKFYRFFFQVDWSLAFSENFPKRKDRIRLGPRALFASSRNSARGLPTASSIA